jgi:hypothetical protein
LITRKKSSATRISEDGAERTVQHLSLPEAVVSAMRRLSTRKAERIGAVWDAACSAFAQKYATKPCTQYEFPHKGTSKRRDYRTLWIDSRILEKCRRIADRDQMSVSRVIHTAAVFFLASQK